MIDTEPLWHQAEVQVLGALGVPLASLGGRQTKGMMVDEVTAYWHRRYPWAAPSPSEVADEVAAAVEHLVATQARLQPGAMEAVEGCRRRGLSVALASSSRHHYIDVALRRCALGAVFDAVCSAQDQDYGKPHPGEFLAAAAALGVAPQACMVWEDSPAGVIAAKAARMAVVAVPDPEERHHPAMALADVALESLEEVDDQVWNLVVEGATRPV